MEEGDVTLPGGLRASHSDLHDAASLAAQRSMSSTQLPSGSATNAMR